MASFDAKKREARNALFVTMTYERNMQDYERAKRDLKVFVQQIRYYYPDCAGVWRLENQERGAIHFHLMLFGVKFLPVTDELAAQQPKLSGKGWQTRYNEIIGETSNSSLDITVMRSFRGTMYYSAKYIAKEQQDIVEPDDTELPNKPERSHVDVTHSMPITRARKQHVPLGLSIRHNRRKSIGRVWGYWNKEGLPLGKKRYAERHISRALASKWLDYIKNPHTKLTYSFTVYDDNVETMFNWFVDKKCPFSDDLDQKVHAGREFRRKDRRERHKKLLEINRGEGKLGEFRIDKKPQMDIH
jgi:hypothetical protein